MSGVTCPECGTVAADGDLFGIEVPGVYDGVLLWQHRQCGHTWPRFPEGDLRHDAARRYLDVAAMIRDNAPEAAPGEEEEKQPPC